MGDASRRSLFKVTLSSIKPNADDERAGRIEKRQRGIEKIAFVGALRATRAELTETLASSDRDSDARTGLMVLADAVGAETRASSRAAWSAIAKTPAHQLAAAARALAEHRRTVKTRLTAAAKALVDDHHEHLRAEAIGAVGTRAVPAPAPPPAPPPMLARTAPQPPSEPGTIRPYTGPKAENPWSTSSPGDSRITAASMRGSLGAAIDWARVNAPERANELNSLVHRVVGVDAAALAGLDKANWDLATVDVVDAGGETEDWTDDLTDGFEERMDLEPIGRVHLERVDMTPVEVLRGELIHSVGLSPKESVQVIHREWSSRETGFEKMVSDEFEQSTEEGVTENTELASATEVQSRHSTELSAEATASGSYMFASASVSVGYSSTSEDENAKTESRNHTNSVTRKASARTKKEHKTTFTVKETAGVEDQVVRTITNPSDEAMRVDFHQLLRKWRVDLYRYGLRLTYDLVIPAPGIDLLANIDELRRIEHELAQPFTLALQPSSISTGNFSSYAATYNAEVPEPPAPSLLTRQQLQFGEVSADDSKKLRFETFEFDVPAGYKVKVGTFAAYFTLDKAGFFDVFDDPPQAVQRPENDPADNDDYTLLAYISNLDHLKGRSGKVAAVMTMHRLRSGYAHATIEAIPTPETMRAWQYAVWTAIRRAAEDQWNAKRQQLAQRRDALNAEIDGWDPLSLRKMEREEVMKTTLKWLFGPAFDLMPSEQARLYGGGDGGVATIEPSKLSAAQWAQVVGIGEFIKYLQQAIEWENVLYFVYPYFWDHPRNHKLKRFLNHPDSLHRAFLRGGAARVVLTVRPGFETSFTQLIETGTLDEVLAADHPYVTIADEIRNYAATHYPGLPPSGDEETIDAAERGIKIGTWTEYTPVSALDISINTPLSELT